MKNNKILPTWSQERIDIDADLQRLRLRWGSHRAWLAARAVHAKTLPSERILDAARVTSRADEKFIVELEHAVAGAESADRPLQRGRAFAEPRARAGQPWCAARFGVVRAMRSRGRRQRGGAPPPTLREFSHA